MSTDAVLNSLEADLGKALEHLQQEFGKLQIGRASASLVDSIEVEAYGTMQPLKAVANISVPDAKTIQIQPWDRSTLATIEKGIMMAELGLTPANDGVVIRINIPPLTEERRRDLTKIVSKMAEEAKIAVRNLRHEAMDAVKKMKNNSEITEDVQSGTEKRIQEKVDHFNKEIEIAAKSKEQDIMTV